VIRVLIVSAIRLYRDGLSHVLGRDARVQVTGVYETIERSIAQPPGEAERPDVVLLDTSAPDALRDIRLVSAEFPGTKVVALGVGRDDADVITCAEAGVAGYVFRDASIEELVATVHSAARGELLCSPEMAGTLLRRVANLARTSGSVERAHVTRREREILQLIDDGLSNKEIAARLFIEVATVKNHIHHILEKLGARTRSEAVAIVRRGSSTRSESRDRSLR
jgi:two-component system, NarL family, nitrate/nitrite response regulator NarL